MRPGLAWEWLRYASLETQAAYPPVLCNAAVFAERKKKDDTMTIKLGNLLPGQSATLKIHIMHTLDVVGGYYGF